MNDALRPNAGLYIHVPFCKSLCRYCDFYSKIARPGEIDRYIEALEFEATLRAKTIFSAFNYDSIFIGGGTPSLLSQIQITSLFKLIRSNFNILSDTEITIECNPSSLNAEMIQYYHDIGINRISLGVQSFNDGHLERLGRLQDSKEARESVVLIRKAGFENIGLDLIYGLPEQTLLEWQDDIKEAIKLEPAHISAYNLIIEQETPFGKLFEEGRLKLPSEDVQNLMYDLLNKMLFDSGYSRYEISNFARPGFECRHNLKYWHLEPYLGLGPAAVSFDGTARYKNISDLPAYLKAARWMELPPHEVEPLDNSKLREEMIMMGLRLSQGLSIIDLNKRFGYDISISKSDIISSLSKAGYIKIENGHIKLAPDTYFISDEIILKLI
jgi:oxygen-independent coproporphyrinogen III oxidase